MDFVKKQAEQKFAVRVNPAELMKQLGLVAGSITVSAPKAHSINRNSSPKPWAR